MSAEFFGGSFFGGGFFSAIGGGGYHPYLGPVPKRVQALSKAAQGAVAKAKEGRLQRTEAVDISQALSGEVQSLEIKRELALELGKRAEAVRMGIIIATLEAQIEEIDVAFVLMMMAALH